MKNIKTVWCWWWGWSPEKIENILEQMESKGWNLLQIGFGGIRLKFEKGESKKMRYCADFHLNVDKSYFNLFRDDGWELVWNGACGWYIWRKDYTNERPNIYTDTKSLIERNKRLLRMISLIFTAQIFLFSTSIEKITRMKAIISIYILIFIFEGYAIIQLNRYIKKQQNSIKE